MLGTPRIRDRKDTQRPYPLNQIPKKYLIEIGKHISYLIATGEKGITGEKWEEIFAKSIGGDKLGRSLGLADVVKDNFSWSVKTVKSNKPHYQKSIRIISGRNNVKFSYGIENPLDNIEKTGEAVISIFNERLRTAKSNYKDLTHSFLLRSDDLTSYTLFEIEAYEIDPKTIIWNVNKNGNFEGRVDGKHRFTWQPDGSQFTVIYTVPDDAIKFTIKKPEPLNFDLVIKEIGFDKDWVTIK
ncbi:hypothetical protein [Photobacterium angustum]|uniref:hypothetical protein n=1 Tax=Photobacterium angustum TaxID=661 RepID=UPI0005E8052F|nr:hypothetical protein [Photobacterium angustum]KJG15287.1 hypothetical protein UA33_20175 [Photobacterium angustum]KJG20345.1 hypothetical protein UA39_19850 [Photobacterium angustum]KJG27319.1 hypothetical protein UA36_20245 [Photobacterium angustum]PSW91269.1 hypothetical protein C0W79_20975 [Photobacterium angustum]PSX03322.1 hypothetical protein C0W87_04355 [Photobacterium angustum]